MSAGKRRKSPVFPGYFPKSGYKLEQSPWLLFQGGQRVKKESKATDRQRLKPSNCLTTNDSFCKPLVFSPTYFKAELNTLTVLFSMRLLTIIVKKRNRKKETT